MGTDIRKHTVPLAGETPQRQAFNDLSATINDIIPIANATERGQLVTDLGGAYEGLTIYRLDMFWVETYLNGAWAITAGRMPFISLGRSTVASPANNVDSTLSGWSSTTAWQCTESGGTVTVPVAGRYMISAGGAWSSNATGIRRVQITKNGTSFVLAPTSSTATAAIDLSQTVARPVILAAADTLTMRLYQTSGGTLDFGTTACRPFFEAHYIGPA